MKQCRLYTSILVWMLVLLITWSAHACWVGYSPQDLFDKSDVIVVGRIIDSTDEFKTSMFWMTNWQVQVDYTVKGELQTREIFVATPGAAGKGVFTSIDYSLNTWGNYVLLFLQDRDGHLEPLSPQGVIALEQNGEDIEKINTGEDFLKAYQFSGTKETLGSQGIMNLLQKKQITTMRPEESNALQAASTHSWWNRITAFFLNFFTRVAISKKM